MPPVGCGNLSDRSISLSLSHIHTSYTTSLGKYDCLPSLFRCRNYRPRIWIFPGICFNVRFDLVFLTISRFSESVVTARPTFLVPGSGSGSLCIRRLFAYVFHCAYEPHSRATTLYSVVLLMFNAKALVTTSILPSSPLLRSLHRSRVAWYRTRSATLGLARKEEGRHSVLSGCTIQWWTFKTRFLILSKAEYFQKMIEIYK